MVPATTITAAKLRDLELPPGQAKVCIHDDDVTGFRAEKRRTGTTLWFRGRDERGRQREIKLGRLGDVTVDEARRRARELRAAVSLGRDPFSERAARRAALTVKQLADDHFLPHSEKTLRGHQNNVGYCRRIVQRLGSKALDEVTHADVNDFREHLRKQGLASGTVNRHLAALRRMLNLAKRWGLFKGDNPAASPGMLREQHRERFLTEAEERRLIRSLDDEPNRNAATILVLLLATGARKSEMMLALWQHVDLERGQLTVPRSKNGRTRHVPLPPVAVMLLRRQLSRRIAGNPYVFPGTKEGQPVEDVRRAWARVKRAADLPADLRIHDLRHSMASRLASAGTPLNEIGAILGHQMLSTTQRYAHFQHQRLIETSAIASKGWSVPVAD